MDIKKLAQKGIALLLVLAIGIGLGIFMDQRKLQKDLGSLINTSELVVVNLDEGVEQGKDKKYYSKDILETLDTKPTITGLEDARSGVESGRYAAYMIIPANFSSNVVSINDNPKRSEIKYEMGTKLDEESKLNTYKKIVEFSDSLNEDISYIYLYSIFSEIHISQTNAKSLLQNDQIDKELLNSISAIDLIQAIELKEIERLDNNIADLDFEEERQSNTDKMILIDSLYKEYLAKVETDSNILKDDNQLLNDNINLFSNNFKNFKILAENGVKNYNLNNAQEHTNNFNGTQLENVESLKGSLTNLESLMNFVDEDTGSLIDDIEIHNNNLSAAPDKSTFKELLEGSKDNALESLLSVFGITLENSDLLFDAVDLLNGRLQESVGYVNNERSIKSSLIAQQAIEQYLVDSILSVSETVDVPELNLEFVFEFTLSAEMQDNLNEFATMQGIESPLTLRRYYEITRGLDPSVVLTYGELDHLQYSPTTTATDRDGFKEDLKNEYLSDIDKILAKTDELSEKPDLLDIDDFKTKKNEAVNYIDKSIVDENVENIKPMTWKELSDNFFKDLQPLTEEQEKTKENYQEALNQHAANSFNHNDNIHDFDPLKYVDSREIEGEFDHVDRNSNTIYRKVNDKNKEYNQFVSKSYKLAEDQTRNMYDTIVKTKQLSDEKLNKGLEDAKASRSATSGANAEGLNRLINMLPYSKLGETENTAIYRYFVNSIDMELKNIEMNSPIENGFDYTILLVIVGGLAVGYIVVSLLKKSPKEEEDI